MTPLPLWLRLLGAGCTFAPLLPLWFFLQSAISEDYSGLLLIALFVAFVYTLGLPFILPPIFWLMGHRAGAGVGSCVQIFLAIVGAGAFGAIALAWLVNLIPLAILGLYWWKNPQDIR